MKIKNQFIISIISFIIVLLIISASAITTNQQVAQLNLQQQLAKDIQNGASDLSYISNDYFLYQESSQPALWQSRFASISDKLSKINPTSPQQQVLADNVKVDLQRLNSVFTDVMTFLESAPRNVSVRVLPAFQTAWSRMVIQNRALAFDASQMAQELHDQADQLQLRNILIIFALLGLFGAYFTINYLITYRRTLRSISGLQAGIKIVGSGKLDYSLKTKTNDEIGEISNAFDQMTANLRNLTASKIDLEREIAEREKAEKDLRESEERWSTTLSSIGDAVIATDVTGAVTFMNSVAEELTGWMLSEALGKALKEVFHIINEETRGEVESPVAKVLEKGLVVGLANHSVLIRKGGSEVPIDDSGAPIKDENGTITGVVLVFRDIRERKEMQQKIEEYTKNLEKLVDERSKRLKDAERLAAIGATAGMVGHDIRNPLQAITGDLYLAKTDLASIPESEEKKNALESLQEIEKNIDYINKIVMDLQDFARPLNPRAEEADLKHIVEELLTKNGLPENVKASVKVESEARTVRADSTFINRIMYNLVNNAVQAMPKGGKLTIHAYKEKRENDVIITVEDTGIGIPEEVHDKLFTPMFTTKSKGQGFGLAVVKRMTEALGGTVTFESQQGKGTTFIVRLPQQRDKR